jgi:hypothetical protein
MADLELLVERLCRAKVEFVIVGGYAAAAHGVTLVTQDVDICCPFDMENLMRLRAALDGSQPKHRMTPDRRPVVITPESCAGLKNLYLQTDIGQLDCLGEVKGIGPYPSVKEASVEVDVGAFRCRILSVAGLLAAKRAMGRERDREAVVQLEAILERRGGA